MEPNVETLLAALAADAQEVGRLVDAGLAEEVPVLTDRAGRVFKATSPAGTSARPIRAKPVCLPIGKPA